MPVGRGVLVAATLRHPSCSFAPPQRLDCTTGRVRLRRRTVSGPRAVGLKRPSLLLRAGSALAGGFVEDDRSGSGGVEGLNAAGHRNVNAGIGAALDLFWETCAFVADKECNRLAPIDFPRRKRRRRDTLL